ncbi:MAG: carboxylating nicotinate-nucleotide diphosphorylase [Corynebacteriales bacterium]|nr:carboxylating nicotinate-nucleotide diphosphorylase [Mycobacteriales bacterium]
MTLSEPTAQALAEIGIDPQYVDELAQRALAEDLGGPRGVDVTTVATFDAEQMVTAEVVARAAGIIVGLPIAAAVFDVASGGRCSFTAHVAEASAVLRGDVLATIVGPARAVLTAERTALNLLCRTSGVATHAFLWAQELVGTGATVLDTRKTTPGLRRLEKYAVRAGGGGNKRMGLYDVAMIKDNHKRAAGSITAAYKKIQDAFPDIITQVEVTNVDEALEAVKAGATFLLCDNMTTDQLTEVVAAVREAEDKAHPVELEATGNLTLERAKEVAATGVNYLSVGGLTHSSPIVDIALDIRD